MSQINLKPSLTIFCGGMFSGKTTELLRQGQRHLIAGRKVVYVKPSLETRYSLDEIVTHDGIKVQSTLSEPYNLLMQETLEADVILVDEIQFFDTTIRSSILQLLAQGKVIYCAGLDLDHTGKHFETTAVLMGLADDIKKCKAVCTQCGDDAYITIKHAGGTGRIELGGKEIYEPRCRLCFRGED